LNAAEVMARELRDSLSGIIRRAHAADGRFLPADAITELQQAAACIERARRLLSRCRTHAFALRRIDRGTKRRAARTT
jgi:hypothetical protein